MFRITHTKYAYSVYTTITSNEMLLVSFAQYASEASNTFCTLFSLRCFARILDDAIVPDK